MPFGSEKTSHDYTSRYQELSDNGRYHGLFYHQLDRVVRRTDGKTEREQGRTTGPS
jgi:hypothetical protein